jgi:hypothetical protein
MESIGEEGSNWEEDYMMILSLFKYMNVMIERVGELDKVKSRNNIK